MYQFIEEIDCEIVIYNFALYLEALTSLEVAFSMILSLFSRVELNQHLKIKGSILVHYVDIESELS